MNICVFGAASSEIDPIYIKTVEGVCEALAKRGHDLVFGAGMNGLMGAAARGFRKGGGKITGIIPEFFKDETIEKIYDDCDELIYTESMRERKQLMESNADCFLVVPGGIGTFEEMFEVLTLKQLGRHKKPIAFYNINGYYNHIMDAMNLCSTEGFIRESVHDLYICEEDAEKIFAYLEDSSLPDYTVKDLKDG